MRVGKLVQHVMAATLFSLVAACGGGGGGGGAAVSAGSASATSSTPSSTIFVSDANNSAIGSQIDANPSAGSIVLDRVIYGMATRITPSVNGLAIDSTADRLFVTEGTVISVFDHAGTTAGDVAPSRFLSQVGIGGYRSPVLDKANDRLYVANLFDQSYTTGSIYVFNNASTASLAAPSRIITSDFGGTGTPGLYSIALDTTRDKIYALVRSAYTIGSSSYSSYVRIAVFNHASTVYGTLTPDGYINIGPSSAAGSVIIDAAHDRLYVSMYGVVDVFDNASTLSGSVTPTRIINFGGGSLMQMAVDLTNNRLYALAPTALYILDNASTATGTVAAKQITVSSASQLTAVAVKQ